MKPLETVSMGKYVRTQTGLKPRLASRICFLPRLFLQGLVLSATVALIPGRPSEVRAVTTGHGAWLQQRCAGAVVNPVVTNNGDSGAGSLRQAIMDACDGSTITFGNTVTSPITLTTATLVINKNLSITGPGANLLTVERSSLAGTPLFRIFTTNSALTVTISGLTVTNGRAPDAGFGNVGNGGGIFNARGGFFDSGRLTVTNCTISGNQATGSVDGGGGGGIWSSGSLTVTNSTSSGNSAAGGGGGIYNSEGTVTLTNSTISGNQAAFHGGGIFNQGGLGFSITDSTLTVTNSTISGNKSAEGGGMFISAGGIVTLTNNTISGNSTGNGGSGGGIYNLGIIPIRARACIIAGNSGPVSDVDGGNSFTSEGFNVIGKTYYPFGFTQATDQTGTIASPLDPMLGPLANNGGPTLTHALLAGSPAIDAGDDSVLGSPLFLTTDQRGLGFPRKLGAHVDSGAFEGQISPSDSMKQLIAVVDGFLLSAPGIGVSLDAKLNAALSALAAGDTTMACVDLSDFINEVFAQAGKKLTDTQAYALWASADSIRTALGCP